MYIVREKPMIDIGFVAWLRHMSIVQFLMQYIQQKI